jgi:hypothetical protein
MPAEPVFLSRFKDLVPAHLDTPWSPEDGLESGELDALLAASPAAQAAQAEGGAFRVPLALYEFHRALGNCPDLLETEHFFWDADELDVKDGYLMFLEDAQESTVWGLPVADVSLPDPLVWRRTTGADEEHGQWSCEGGTFSEFTLDLLEWTFEEEVEDA